MTAAHVELSTRAVKDLRGLDVSTRGRIVAFIQGRLRVAPLPANVDIRPLEGKTPWLRVRIGDVRILRRRLTATELHARGAAADSGYLIVRIVHRRDLDRAVSHL